MSNETLIALAGALHERAITERIYSEQDDRDMALRCATKADVFDEIACMIEQVTLGNRETAYHESMKALHRRVTDMCGGR